MISLGRALVGLVPMSGVTANKVYRGDVLLEDGQVYRGFIKDLDARQLANELLVAALARRLGVEVPKSALIAVGEDASREFVEIKHSNKKDHIAFCSVDASGSTVYQMFAGGHAGPALAMIKRAPGMGRMYGFDTWVANVDRHMNNLVISGDGTTYLIDHGYCFSGPCWEKSDLVPDSAYANKLALWLTPNLSDVEKNEAMRDVHSLVSEMASTDISDAIDVALMDSLYGSDDTAAVEVFLRDRICHVSTITAQALGTLI